MYTCSFKHTSVPGST